MRGMRKIESIILTSLAFWSIRFCRLSDNSVAFFISSIRGFTHSSCYFLSTSLSCLILASAFLFLSSYFYLYNLCSFISFLCLSLSSQYFCMISAPLIPSSRLEMYQSTTYICSFIYITWYLRTRFLCFKT